MYVAENVVLRANGIFILLKSNGHGQRLVAWRTDYDTDMSGDSWFYVIVVDTYTICNVFLIR